MAKKKLYLTIDTETTNGLNDALVYDIGFAVHDKKGKIYCKRHYIISDFFNDRELMNSAYYSWKIPLYLEKLRKGEAQLTTFMAVCKIIRECMQYYNIKIVIAYNMRFDLNALNTTLRYITKSKHRYFFPRGIHKWCSWNMAKSTICKSKLYKDWARAHGLISGNNQPSTSAETVYKYLNFDSMDFKEEHTGLADVLIEVEIFARCMARRQKMRRTYWNDTIKLDQYGFKIYI